MLSSPASGNYLFHEGTVTSVYLGQINRERIVTSPPFCLCLRRHFSLSRCRSEGLTAKPRSRFRSIHAFAAHSQVMQAGASHAPAPARPADPHRQISSTPQIAAAPTKIPHLLFTGQGGRFAAELRSGTAVLQLAY